MDGQIDSVQLTAVHKSQMIVCGGWQSMSSDATAKSQIVNGFTGTLFVAPFPLKITGFYVAFDFWDAIRQTGANWWSLYLDRLRGGSFGRIAGRNFSDGTDGITGTLAARTPLNFATSSIWSTSNAQLTTGDILTLRPTETGAASPIQLPLSWTCRYEPL
jgi:hypothetical protein